MGYAEQNFRDTKSLEIWIYGTSFGTYLDTYQAQYYVKWFYELWDEIPTEESAVSSHVLQETDALINYGFLRLEDKLRLDIPVLSRTEHQEECTLSWKCAEQMTARTRDVLLPVFQSGHVKLPSHLKSVPKWLRYMFCGDSVPMMVIHKAREKGLFMDGVDYPVPASLLVYEK